MALEWIEDGRRAAAVARAADWLLRVQRADGGWGESNDTYFAPERAGTGEESTPYHTAWALLGLCSAGRGAEPGVRAGVDFLLRTRQRDGLWDSESFTAPGFPRVFYLRYHGYSRYFPVWAVARYRRFLATGA
jgi:squalene-hopene/tetraprenyl-beta-curcumene cyclase